VWLVVSLSSTTVSNGPSLLEPALSSYATPCGQKAERTKDPSVRKVAERTKDPSVWKVAERTKDQGPRVKIGRHKSVNVWMLHSATNDYTWSPLARCSTTIY
jgi:hypothetical protein